MIETMLDALGVVFLAAAGCYAFLFIGMFVEWAICRWLRK